MLDVLRSLFAAAAIGLAAFGFGRPLWRHLCTRGAGCDDSSPRETWLWSLALGLLAGGLAITCLAELGGLHELSVGLMTLAGVVSAMLELACVAAGTKFRGSLPRAADQLRTTVRQAGVWTVPFALAGLTLLATFVASLAPPVDSVVLQNAFEPPKQLLLTGGFEATEAASTRLNLAQVWSLWALALDGPVAANLVHWGLAILLALAAAVLGGNWLKSPGNWLAGGLLITSPAACAQFGVAGSGIAAALTATLAAIAILRAAKLGRQSWLMLSAMMLGATLAIDFSVGLLALVVAGAFLALAARDTFCRSSQWLLWSGAALVVAAPWFPSARMPDFEPSGMRSFGGLIGGLGPGLLFGLGALVLDRGARIRSLCWGGVGVVVGLVLLPEDASAGLIAVPLLAVSAACGAVRITRIPPPARLVVLALVCVAITVDLAAQVRQLGPRLAVASGWRSREAYLLEHQGAYRAAAVFNRIRRQGQRLMTLDADGFYFSAPVSDAREQAVSVPREPASEAAWAEIARRQGCDYLLLAHTEKSGPEQDPAGTAGGGVATENLPHTAEVIPILEYRFADDNNRCIRYRLWKLQGSQAAQAQTTADGGSQELTARPRTPAR